ncbi:MAG: hypothetical protein LBK67_05385, partial [Coriobacteriales bacterium]|nr:hypothetical protein [Coriobacteriales bacterium]
MSRYQVRRAKVHAAPQQKIQARKVKGRAYSQAHRPLAVIMAVIMTLAMMLPANLATYAVGPDDVTLQEAKDAQEQQSEEPADAQESVSPEEPADAQESVAPATLEDAQEPQNTPQQAEEPEASQDVQQPEEPATLVPLEAATLVPLDDPDPAEPYESPSGEGTTESPYLIASVADLQWMRTQLSDSAAANNSYRSAYYKLTADIDMTGVEDWGSLNGNAAATAFSGTFDGDGHSISNVRVVAATANTGFFGIINGATIKDLALVNLNVTHTVNLLNTGGIAASVTGPSTISGCYVSGSVTSNGSAVGGIVGASSAAITIENCRVDGSVSGSYNVGGILGRYNSNGAPTIRNSLVMASVAGTGTDGGIGGIFGNRDTYANGNATIVDCRVLSESISLIGGTTIGAIYGSDFAIYSSEIGYGTLTITGTNAWKGLVLDGTPLKEVLYGDSLFNDEKNGAPILSWKLTLQDGWPTGLSAGAWSYTEGKIPVLTALSGKMSNEFPEYMTGYLTPPSGAVDKAALAAAIQAAEVLQVSQYPDAWDEFQISLTRARIILNDDESAQVELNAAVEALEDALELLKSRNALELEGEGTAENPYLVASAAQLQKVNRLINSSDAPYRDKHYKLTADIDMDGLSWSPLGGSVAVTAFTGTFDGNGNTVSNLVVSGARYVGMFGYISGATIKDLALEGYDIKNTSRVANQKFYTAGLVAASVAGSTITGCKVNGTVSGYSYVAGIVAQANGSITIENCLVQGTIQGAPDGTSGGSYVAGIIGRVDGTGATIAVKNCVVSADITGDGSYVGGIAGYFVANNKVTIEDCTIDLSDTGSITANNYASGIVGNTSNNTEIKNCSVIGGTIKAASPTAESYTGGLIGDIPTSSTVTLTDCYVKTD